MSVSINQSKKRINSIQSIKKITNAMKLVSTAKLKTISNRLNGQELFSNKLDLIMNKLSLIGDEINLDYFNDVSNKDNDKVLYIVLTSDLGLCGSYNYNIYHFVDDIILKNSNAYFLILGSKGQTHYQGKNINFDNELFGAQLSDISKLSMQLKNYVLDTFSNKKYAEVHLIYTKYINSLNFKCCDKKILPLSLNFKNKDDIRKEISPIIQPDKESVVKTFVPLYIESLIYADILNSLVSEYSSRRNAMEKASDNASDLLEKLTIEYNKARQEAITNELIEVVSAFNNM